MEELPMEVIENTAELAYNINNSVLHSQGQETMPEWEDATTRTKEDYLNCALGHLTS